MWLQCEVVETRKDVGGLSLGKCMMRPGKPQEQVQANWGGLQRFGRQMGRHYCKPLYS